MAQITGSASSDAARDVLPELLPHVTVEYRGKSGGRFTRLTAERLAEIRAAK
jgi:hypothetical protein